MGQAALLGLMAVAFAAILFARLSGTDPSQTPGLAGEVSGATASPAVVASPDSSGGPAASDGAAPVRTLVPTEVSPSPAPVASPAASGETATTDPPTTDPPTTYKVRRGDTLSGIAAEFGTTVAVLAELNDITDPSRLRVGQVLDLP